MGDHASAMSLFGGIVTALYRRERTGKGGKVSTSLMANGVWSNGCFIQATLCGAQVPPRPPREDALNALTNHYHCRDGRWLILSVLNEERQWPTFAQCIGRGDLVNDPRFADKKSRHANARTLVEILDEAFLKKDLAEWRKILDAAGLIFGVVATLDDMPNDKQMRVSEVLVPFENDTMLTVNSPVWVEGGAKVAPRRAPEIGEHTDEVLRAAGYKPGEIEQLKARGVVA
jgi:formyl-CoA transferase